MHYKCSFLFVLLLSHLSLVAQTLKLDTVHSRMLGGYTLFVVGNTLKPLILGATLIVREKNGHLREYDLLEDMRLEGDFKKNFSMPEMCKANRPDYWMWRAALWETRIDNCGCAYCLRNGFHLEDKVCGFEWIPEYSGNIDF